MDEKVYQDLFEKHKHIIPVYEIRREEMVA